MFAKIIPLIFINSFECFFQLHRDLSWLVANSIIKDSLVEVKAQTYYKEALTNNFFIPINVCFNENHEILFSFNLFDQIN